MVNMLKQETPFMLFMVADQSPMKSEAMHWIKFLNQDTSVYTGSEKLARKFNMPVVYADLLRQKKGVYKMTFKLITDAPQKTREMEITRAFFYHLENSINKSPRYWLWSHRRWKHTRNH
jgi:KDO2-lipid IV(A) lauroyltransferase